MWRARRRSSTTKWCPWDLLPAQRPGLVAHPDDARGHPGHHGVGGHVLGHYRAGADHGIVAHRHPAQDAGAVADPDVVAYPHVALVDALEANGTVDLDHAVVEVDQH